MKMRISALATAAITVGVMVGSAQPAGTTRTIVLNTNGATLSPGRTNQSIYTNNLGPPKRTMPPSGTTNAVPVLPGAIPAAPQEPNPPLAPALPNPVPPSAVPPLPVNPPPLDPNRPPETVPPLDPNAPQHPVPPPQPPSIPRPAPTAPPAGRPK